jgi:hypothetical protein
MPACIADRVRFTQTRKRFTQTRKREVEASENPLTLPNAGNMVLSIREEERYRVRYSAVRLSCITICPRPPRP